LIRKITGALDDDLERMLHDLQVGEFIYEQPALPDVEYIFKHSLTQEVAYNSVLNERRKPLHERTAQALESLFSDQLDDHLPDLARHYSRSGNTSKAVHYLRIAGEQAARRCAHEEAASLFNSALEMLARVPEGQERIRREVELRLAFIGSLVVSKGYAAPEVDESTRRALELSNEIGEPGTSLHRTDVHLGFPSGTPQFGTRERDQYQADRTCRTHTRTGHDGPRELCQRRRGGLLRQTARRPGP
jgi:hypothetical protein